MTGWNRGLKIALVSASLLFVGFAGAESVVYDTSAEFAGGAFTDAEDTGGGGNPAIRIVYNLPFGFGDGRNSSQTIAGDPNARAACSGSAGSTSLSTSLTGNAGDIVLVHQTRGGSSTGAWELNKVVSANGSTMTLVNGLATNYSAQAQVVKVPQYIDLTISGGGPAGWNGTTGGIYAVMCKGTATISGPLSVSGTGYVGGPQVNGNGVVGRQAEGTPGAAGGATTAANGNGSGGGNSSGLDGGGAGSGGGHAGSGTNGGGGQAGQGAPGGAAGNANLTLMVFGGGGGGGGAGRNGDNVGGAGGAGGGIAVIIARTLNVTGSVASSGNNGASTGNNGGAGGGGAGGAVLLTGAQVTLGSNLVTTFGGSGGSAGSANGGNRNGGAGSAGRIHIDFGNPISGTTNPTADTAPLTFKTTGVYSSPAVNIPGASVMGTIQWTFTGGTSVALRTRTSPDGSNWSAWSQYYNTASGSQITSPADEFIQYEALLTGPTNDSPTLTSVTINYTTIVPPSITEEPVSRSVCGGAEVQFTVEAAGDEPLIYQWRKDGGGLTDGGHYAGTGTATLTVSGVDDGDEGDYDCVVTNGGGTATSDPASLTVDTVDTDSDGTPDCADGCPNHPDKTQPGICGCDTAEDDADSDGTPDCNDVPRLLHFQGKLRDAGGAAIEGMRDLTLRFYDAATGGNLLFTESHSAVPMTRGLFRVLIGTQTTGGVPDTAVDRSDVYIGVSVGGGGELSPRSRVPAEPYVIKAKASEGLVRPGTLNPAVTVDAAGQVGVGTPAPSEALHVVGNILATGSITPGSSRTLKRDIDDLSLNEAAAVLDALQPVKFRYKAEVDGEMHLGFIAEDVPELVSAARRRGVDSMDIVAVLTRIVQQQQEVIRGQSDEIRQYGRFMQETRRQLAAQDEKICTLQALIQNAP